MYPVINKSVEINRNNESYYLHGDPTISFGFDKCPDLADVVYLTPTSSNWFDPTKFGFHWMQ